MNAYFLLPAAPAILALGFMVAVKTVDAWRGY